VDDRVLERSELEDRGGGLRGGGADGVERVAGELEVAGGEQLRTLRILGAPVGGELLDLAQIARDRVGKVGVARRRSTIRPMVFDNAVP
jgi:hypothetical protein